MLLGVHIVDPPSRQIILWFYEFCFSKSLIMNEFMK